MSLTDAAGFGRQQGAAARTLVPVRLAPPAALAPPARQPAALPVRLAAPQAAPAAGARHGIGRTQQVLITLMVIATVGGLVGSGTFATFNGLTQNVATITSGVLVLGDKVNAGSVCFSAGGAVPSNPQPVSSANTSACTAVWSLTTEQPGTAISPLQMTIRNAGNLSASQLEIYAAAACADSTNGTGYNGGGSLCGQTQLEIEQYTDGTFGTPSHCWYGSTSGALCLAEANKLPAGCNVSTCTSYSFSDPTKTLANFGSTVTSGAPINSGALASNGSAYFLVFAALPNSSGDTFQGRRADLNFTWRVVQ